MKTNSIKKLSLFLLIIGIISPLLFADEKLGKETTFEGKHSYIPDSGYVPDEETALKIAGAVLLPIYGKETLGQEQPFKAVLVENIWHVSGHLPEGWRGGVAEIEINKTDGKILRVSHGK